jgi:hypothetical protein
MPGITLKIGFFIKKKFWIFLEKIYFVEISKYQNFEHFVIQNQMKYRKNKALFSLWKNAFMSKISDGTYPNEVTITVNVPKTPILITFLTIIDELDKTL